MKKRFKLFMYSLCLVAFLTNTSNIFAAPVTQTVRIAAFNFYPAIFQAKNGSVQGFYVDFLSEIAKQEGWNIEYVYGNWSDGLARIKTGEVDVLTNVAFTNERSQFMDYGKEPLLTVWAELYTPNDSSIDNIRQVKGKKIAVMKGDFNAANFKNLLEKFQIPCQIIEYGNFEEVFRAISSGLVDGGVANNSFGAAKSREFNLKSSGIIFNPFDIYFTTAKGKNRHILDTLDTYLIKWRKTEGSPYHLARERWSHGTTSTITVTPVWLKRALLALMLGSGLPVTFILLLRNQVRRKTSELKIEIAEREKSEQLFRELFQNAADPIYIVDMSGKILDVNKQACRELGYTYEEMLTKKISDLDVVYQEPEKVTALFQELLNKTSVTFETIHLSKDNREICAEIHTSIIDYGGKQSVMGVARNISARKRNERSMSELYNISQYPFTTEQEFLDHALHQVIILTDSKIGYIYFYNEKSRQFTLNTWSKDVMKECCIHEQQTVYDLDSTGIWGEAVRQRRPVVMNDFLAHHPQKKGLPDGHVPLYRFLTVPVIIEEAIVAVVGVANKSSEYLDEDIMELNVFMDAVWKIVAHKRAEKETQKLEQQLLHAQKLESLGVLAGGIAHDFNNILMAIIGNAELALMRVNRESPAVENLHRIQQATARAADLSKQMLAYSGKGKFVIENIDLNRLLEEMVHMLEVSISKNVVLRFNLQKPFPTVEADATQMRQIIMNLVINASEAIKDRNGVISITTGCMDCDRNYLKNVWLDNNVAEGLYVYLEIADTGCGMDKETMAKLFDPFFTTKFTGRGLGMAAVLGIVRGHKGAVKVYSEVNKGTTFKILLPASWKSVDLTDNVCQTDDWQGEGTVLLVDDEETVRSIGAEMLKELGFDTIAANDGMEAVEIYKNKSADIAFVILDLTMPNMGGEQCFLELRRHNHNVKVIMSSGYNEQEVTQKFVGKGLAGFVQKPYSLSVLKDAIKNFRQS